MFSVSLRVLNNGNRGDLRKLWCRIWALDREGMTGRISLKFTANNTSLPQNWILIFVRSFNVQSTASIQNLAAITILYQIMSSASLIRLPSLELTVTGQITPSLHGNSKRREEWAVLLPLISWAAAGENPTVMTFFLLPLWYSGLLLLWMSYICHLRIPRRTVCLCI